MKTMKEITEEHKQTYHPDKDHIFTVFDDDGSFFDVDTLTAEDATLKVRCSLCPSDIYYFATANKIEIDGY